MIRLVLAFLAISYVRAGLVHEESKKAHSHQIATHKSGVKRINHKKHSRKAAIEAAMVDLYGKVECIWHDEELCKRVLNEQTIATYLHAGTVNKGINQEFWLDDAILAIEEDYCRTCDLHKNDECTCEYIHGLSFEMTSLCPPPAFAIGQMCYTFTDPTLNICPYTATGPLSQQTGSTGSCNFVCMEPCVPSILALYQSSSSNVFGCDIVQQTIATCGSGCSDKQTSLWISFTGCTCDVLPSEAACLGNLECAWDSAAQKCNLSI